MLSVAFTFHRAYSAVVHRTNTYLGLLESFHMFGSFSRINQMCLSTVLNLLSIRLGCQVCTFTVGKHG